VSEEVPHPVAASQARRLAGAVARLAGRALGVALAERHDGRLDGVDDAGGEAPRGLQVRVDEDALAVR